MLDAHIPARALRDYRHGRLSPADMLAVSDHLADCGDCRQALGEIDDGPDYESLAAFVDGCLDPAARENLETRLADSTAAQDELADLQRFKQEMSRQTGLVYGPTSGQGPERTDGSTLVTPPVEAWRGRRSWLAMAAAVVLLAAGWWMFGASGPTTDATRLLTDANGRRADLAALPPDLRAGVEHALRSGRLDKAALAPELRPHSGVLAGADTNAPAGFRVLGPAGAEVRETRPTLRWTPCPSATGYFVTLTSRDGADTRTSPELPGTQTFWAPPEPLVSGTVYAWQVEALAGAETLTHAPAPPAAEARFQILSEVRRTELARTEEQFGKFPLVLAVAYAHAGLEEEAAAQLTKLARDHPASAVAGRLRRDAEAVQSPSPISTKGAQ